MNTVAILRKLGFPTVAGKPSGSAPFLHRSETLRVMRSYVALNTPENLYITGPVLSGKTWVASRLALELHLRGISAEDIIYSTLMDMVSDILDNSAKISKYYDIKFLFIDNVNTEKNAFAPSLLSRVVRHRLDNDKPTVVVSSLDDDTLATMYGEEMQQRLAQFIRITLKPDQAALRSLRDERDNRVAEDLNA